MLKIPAVFLPPNSKATLDYPGLQGFPLFFHRIIPKKVNVIDIYSLLDWLDVEHSPRYQPKKNTTHCDAYVVDYCACRGVYVPNVFWHNHILSANKPFPEKIILRSPNTGGTVRELNANGIYDWFVDYGACFGWSEISNLTTLQDLANGNAVCVISAKNRNPQRPGHIVAVIPELYERRALAVRDKNAFVVYPVTSEAGGKCRKISIGDNWFRGEQFDKQVKLWANNV